MKKVKDTLQESIHRFQVENLTNPIVKGTQVSFKLPTNLHYTSNGQKVTVDIGIVMGREEKYQILYKNETIEVKPEDILATKAQLDSIKISDSVIATNKIVIGNANDMVNMRNRLVPNATDKEFESIEKSIEDLGLEVGDELICYTSEEMEDDDIEGFSIEPLEISGMYFGARLL